MITRNPQYNTKRQRLNVPLLIEMGAIFITHPHGEDGWEVNDEIWSYSLITLYNVLHGGWAEFAPRYIKPISYHHAAYQINHSAPNLGNSTLVYDEKYRQIMWSIDHLLTTQNKHIILQQYSQ